jgi:protein SCO1/2
MKISKLLPIYVFIPLFVAAVMLYFIKANPKQPPLPEIHGIYLQKPEFVMPFALTQTDGTPFTDQNLLGHWSLIFFGFTYCPDICPTTLALLNNVSEGLKQAQPALPPLKIVFISVDPERDNLAQLDKYIHYFNPEFTAATGHNAQLELLTKQLGVVFAKIETDPKRPDEYLMEHSTSMALINPQGGIQAIFTSPHQVEALIQDITWVLQAE